MKRAVSILVWILALVALPALCANGQADPPAPGASVSSAITAPPDPRMIDAVAVRIEDDIITESEVRELAAFQLLVDGRSKPREELIRELVDQWILQGEARVANYQPPSEQEVDQAFGQLVEKFSSPEEFKKRCAEVDLTQQDVRRLVSKQVYLSGFLDYRFRPAAQVDPKQIAEYYNQELVPKLKAQNQPVPALEDVEDTIQEVLVQRAISQRSAQWLEETRARLKIDVMPDGDRP
jgi:hypothetical protein